MEKRVPTVLTQKERKRDPSWGFYINDQQQSFSTQTELKFMTFNSLKDARSKTPNKK